MARALQDAGAEVFVAAPALPEGVPGVVAPHPYPEPAAGAEGPAASAAFDPRQVARDLLLWPDPDARWSLRAAEAARRSVPFRPDWIVTTAPPESVHRAGLRLRSALGGRWLADVRDTWFLNPRTPGRLRPLRRAGERLWARRLLRAADAITAVDETVAAEARALSGGRPATVLPQLRAPLVEGAPLEPADAVHVVFTGQISIGDPGRSVRDMLAPFEAARARRPSLILHVAGHLTGGERAALAASPAAAAIRFHGALPLDRVLALQSGADVLLVQGSDGSTAVPGKLAEYRATGAPIVAVGAGPWRSLAGLPDQDPVEALAAARKRTGPRPDPGPDPAAAAFLELLGRGG